MTGKNLTRQEESKDAAEIVSAASLCAMSLAAAEASQPCPVCTRTGTLLAIGDALFCAACGYASDGAAGCT
ncbi:MAG: hypothetical protein V9H69_14770 [Anaerolineae bacterium]|jgi:hypothetical protein